MNEIIDDRDPDWFRQFMKMVAETSGPPKMVSDKISAELEKGKPASAEIKKA